MQTRSQKTGKPILMLFQEVPGCQTCVDFGLGPLSNRILVEAIESEFIPTLAYNNKKSDAPLLKQFQEPSWNNPVVRFLDGDLKDVLPRKDGIWSTGGIARRMVQTLEKSKRKVPEYLKCLATQLSKQSEVASFAMHCYWEGEVQFGLIDGVKWTHSAWYDGKEIVNVVFDPTVLDYKTLLVTATKARCASTIYTRNASQQKTANALAKDRVERIGAKEFGKPAKDSDQKYYLQHSLYRLLPLASTQQVKVNSALGRRSDPKKFLSPKQIKMLIFLDRLQKSNRGKLDEISALKTKLTFEAFFDHLFAVSTTK